MRTLFDIVEGAKDGIKPSHDECYYAMLALDALLHFDHQDLRRLAYNETKVPVTILASGSFDRLKRALGCSPLAWLGTQVPGNRDYDRMRRAAFAILKKVEEARNNQG